MKSLEGDSMYDYEVIDLNILELLKPLKSFLMLKLSFLISGCLFKLAVLSPFALTAVALRAFFFFAINI